MNIKTIIIVPIIFVVILSIVLTNFFISFEEKVFNEQSKKIENKIISEQKNSIKYSINNIITILNQKSELFINLQKEIIKERTNNAIQLIDNIYKENSHLKEKEIFVKIKQYLNFISSSDKSKYYYIYKMDGTCISVPANRNLEGKNLINLQDIKGQYVIKTVIDIAKNGGGFNEWYYLNPKSNKIEKKIGYVVIYKPLNIFIGTAVYEQDIIKNIKQFSSHLFYEFKTSYGGYIFAYDDKGNTIAHIKKDLIGVNRWDLKKNGRYLLQDLIKKGQQKGGSFLEYEATINPKTKQAANKISFLNEFKKLKWVIGTGFYTDELYADIKKNQEKLRAEFEKELQTIIISTIIFTLLLIAILWLVLSKLSKKLIHYRKELENNNQKLENLNNTLEDKVKEKTKEQKILLDSLPIAIEGYNKNREVVYWNKAAEDIYGYNQNEVIGEKLENLIIPNFMKSDVINAVNNWYENGIKIESSELTLISKDGSYTPVYSSHIMISDEFSNPIMYCMDIDLKPQKELLKKDKLLIEQSKSAQMGEMIGNIAHQWRQPLSIISTAASGIIISKELNSLTNEQENEMLHSIVKNTQFLSNTIDIFRDYIKEKKELKEVILQDRLRGAINIIEASLKNNHIELINSIDNIEPIKITMIVGELSQVIINILNNAKDILVQNNIDNKIIKIDLVKKENNVVITIEDNAGGIPEDILPKIFDPYFTTKHQSQGTGLGLHMSKDIVEKHLNGKLYAQNINDGAIFIIELPLQ